MLVVGVPRLRFVYGMCAKVCGMSADVAGRAAGRDWDADIGVGR